MINRLYGFKLSHPFENSPFIHTRILQRSVLEEKGRHRLFDYVLDVLPVAHFKPRKSVVNVWDSLRCDWAAHSGKWAGFLTGSTSCVLVCSRFLCMPLRSTLVGVKTTVSTIP